MFVSMTLTLVLTGATAVSPDCPKEQRALMLQEEPARLASCTDSTAPADRVWGAHALAATGQFDAAAALYRKLESETSLSAIQDTLRIREARVLLAAGHPADGLQRLKSVSPQRSWVKAELSATRADLLFHSGDFAGAMSAAKEALAQRHPSADSCWLTYARAARRSGKDAQFREALRHLEIDFPESPATAAAEQLAPPEQRLQLSQGDLATRWTHWTAHGGASQVAKECSARLKTLKGSAEKLAGLRLLCGRALSTARESTAPEMLRSAAVGKTKPAALLAIAQIAARKKDPKPVAALCKELAATKSANERAECEFLVAFVTLQSGDHPAAKLALQKVMSAFPTHARAADAEWFIALDSLHTPEAAEQFDRLASTAKGADRARALYWRGRVRDEAHLPGAADDWKATLEADPLGFYGWLAAARLSPTEGKESAVCAALIRSEPPDLAEAKVALLLLQTGFTREAAWELGQVASIRGENAYAWASLLASVDQWERVLDIGVANGARRGWPVSDGERKGVEALYPRAFPTALSGVAGETNPCLVLAVMRRESRFDPDATSPAEAVGLLQLLPKTARSLAAELKLDEPDPLHLHDPGLNVRLGAHYIRRLLDRFHSPLMAAAAYNAGAKAVARWTTQNANMQVDEWVERIPYRETRNYAKAVGGAFAAYSLIYGGARPAVDWTPITAAGDGIDY